MPLPRPSDRRHTHFFPAPADPPWTPSPLALFLARPLLFAARSFRVSQECRGRQAAEGRGNAAPVLQRVPACRLARGEGPACAARSRLLGAPAGTTRATQASGQPQGGARTAPRRGRPVPVLGRAVPGSGRTVTAMPRVLFRCLEECQNGRQAGECFAEGWGMPGGCPDYPIDTGEAEVQGDRRKSLKPPPPGVPGAKGPEV
jgi:hypothetical protein